MLKALKQAWQNSLMAIYFRILAVIIAYGATVHIANILGWGEIAWAKMPLSWRIGDIVYGCLDLVTAIGLWQKTSWGIVCFLSLITSQFIIYTIFIDYFAFTPGQRETIYQLLGIEAILILIFFWLLFSKK